MCRQALSRELLRINPRISPAESRISATIGPIIKVKVDSVATSTPPWIVRCVTSCYEANSLYAQLEGKSLGEVGGAGGCIIIADASLVGREGVLDSSSHRTIATGIVLSHRYCKKIQAKLLTSLWPVTYEHTNSYCCYSWPQTLLNPVVGTFRAQLLKD